MRRLIEIATERRVTIVMFVVAIGLFGLVSLSRLAMNLLPDISYPTLTIQTEYTDAAPDSVEQFITQPVEEAVGVLRGLAGMKLISADVVEVAPAYDHAEITSLAAATSSGLGPADARCRLTLPAR